MTGTEQLVRTALHEVAPDADLDTLHAGDDLRETLHLDSLDFLQLVELLSARTGHRIEEEDYPQLATLAGTVAFLDATQTRDGPG
ncbi:acyl carrier protein [Dactylosporangium sp. CA-052675]|uniref:acyl carrier protein n=1 Tax=Dactylosporangium sp. CA-052675 TaxID=3239927 RepID=UPI003D8FE891